MIVWIDCNFVNFNKKLIFWFPGDGFCFVLLCRSSFPVGSVCSPDSFLHPRVLDLGFSSCLRRLKLGPFAEFVFPVVASVCTGSRCADLFPFSHWG
jgi:hypothetical protein